MRLASLKRGRSTVDYAMFHVYSQVVFCGRCVCVWGGDGGGDGSRVIECKALHLVSVVSAPSVGARSFERTLGGPAN